MDMRYRCGADMALMWHTGTARRTSTCYSWTVTSSCTLWTPPRPRSIWLGSSIRDWPEQITRHWCSCLQCTASTAWSRSCLTWPSARCTAALMPVGPPLMSHRHHAEDKLMSCPCVSAVRADGHCLPCLCICPFRHFKWKRLCRSGDNAGDLSSIHPTMPLFL